MISLSEENNKLRISESAWGNIDGKEIKLFTLENSKGMCIKISNYGAIVQSLLLPDKQGNFIDIVLGYDKLEDYVNDPFYLGAIIGRYANRIANGKISINNTTYQLTQNNGTNHLHGGASGFGRKIFSAEIIRDDNAFGIRFFYYSPDGEEGFPGNLKFWVTYTLNNDNEWRVDYKAETDKTTVVNFTQHTYFNLSGSAERSVENHQLKINADYYLPVNQYQIPIGNIESVFKTPFDFTALKEIGKDINSINKQLQIADGYDHSFVINKTENKFLHDAAIVYEPQTAISLKVLTSNPSVHFYSGNFLDGKYIGKNKKGLLKRSGFCLETQHFPDAPNNLSFPSTLLEPGENYNNTTIYSFQTK